ncbi:MAG: acyl-CoA dehydrogenase, partial [Alphaproteobacteria bacterium]
MNFEFSEDQMFLKEQANKFLSEKCDLTVNRKVLESDAPYDKDLWQAVVEMGWT